MSIDNLIASVKSRQNTRGVTSRKELQPAPIIEQHLNKIRSKRDRLAYNLVLSWHKNNEAVKSKLLEKNTLSYMDLLLVLNHEYSLAQEITIDRSILFERLEHAIVKAEVEVVYGELWKLAYHNEIKARLNNCVELAPAGPAAVNQPIKGEDGRYRNEKLRACFSQMYGVAMDKGLMLGSVTINLNEKYIDKIYEQKSVVPVKDALRYRLDAFLPANTPNRAFVFEIAGERGIHLHGFVLFERQDETALRKSLRKLGTSNPNSVMIKTSHESYRQPALYELMQAFEEYGRDVLWTQVRQRTSLTVGAADYLSKDLGKRTLPGGQPSRVLTNSGDKIPGMSFEDFYFARKGLIDCLVSKVRNDWETGDQDAMISALVQNSKGLSNVQRLFTSPELEYLREEP
ncbi:hypothetical protein IDSA_11460 [Pseudidiomarina salinarum]|uniref:Uncharacterized protein n=1 Tax=Pseudidiomarina salinarum TaxID=435908 RepID=A0A094ISP6_9GAMM|nr:hypothetical protein [Pseudidiomarina salinarum]KFZ30172.1 hypothetical protein IDSA_11460 [Pseudidiomarina salinarum]RUO68674.1 hypothetical protein CWI79_11445 [Pseudidiomarina salinarum]